MINNCYLIGAVNVDVNKPIVGGMVISLEGEHTSIVGNELK